MALLVSCAPSFRTDSSFVSATTLRELTNASDIVLIGTVEGESGTRNLARNPKDLTKEDPNYIVVGQDYSVSVQTVLKGAAPQQVTITVARGRGNRARGVNDDADFVPLRAPQLYALFLRRLPYEPTILALAIEPSRFRVDTMVVAESPWPDVGRYFPPQARDTFLGELRRITSAR